MEANTLDLSTQVTFGPGRRAPCAVRASRKLASNSRSLVARVITIVSRATRSSSTTPFPREANRPSVDSRTITRSMSAARGSASIRAPPVRARTGRTPA